MKRLAAFIVLIGLFAVLIQSFQRETLAQELPGVAFLGEGPNEYTIGPNQNFIVKRPVFTFDFEPGPTYTAVGKERVWSISELNAPPQRLFEEWVDLKDKPAGCVVRYIGIDDDLDGRRNSFFLDDELIHTIQEGMVFSGEFVIPRDGNLRLYAADSVGGWIDSCVSIIQPTPEATATPTLAPSPTATATLLIPSPTQDPSITPTTTPSPTPTDEFMPTATSTSIVPTVTETPNTVISIVTPTKKPRLNTCLRINFDVGGQSAKRGLYVVQETGGHVLVEWYAEDGWTDSGWFRDIDITFEAVYVQVLYYSGPGAAPIEMKILNPAPGSPYGWLSRGTCHALEVAWPDEVPGNQNTADPSLQDMEVQQIQPLLSQERPAEPGEESESGSIYAGLSDR